MLCTEFLSSRMIKKELVLLIEQYWYWLTVVYLRFNEKPSNDV